MQQAMLTSFMEHCKTRDYELNGGKKTGLIDRYDFMMLLESDFFATKTPGEVKDLKRALSADQPLPAIHYVRLFSTRTFCHSASRILVCMEHPYARNKE